MDWNAHKGKLRALNGKIGVICRVLIIVAVIAVCVAIYGLVRAESERIDRAIYWTLTGQN